MTLREVSQKLKLSQGLVSNVLNNRPGVRASASTIERIRKYAAESNYEPSAMAKSLRRGRTNIVAFVYLDSDDLSIRSAHGHAAEGIAEVLQDIDYSLLLKVSKNEEVLINSLKTMARQRLCDAVVVFADERIVEPIGETLAEVAMPFVIKGHYEAIHPDWLQVDYDHAGMMRQSVEHLHAIGHRRIFYLGYDGGIPYQLALVDGYKKAMTDLSLGPVPDRWIASLPNGTAPTVELVGGWLRLPIADRPTAIVVGGAHMQFWGIEIALAQIGRKAGLGPTDFAISGLIKPDIPLIHGQAKGFDSCDVSELGRAQAEKQLIPLLQTGACDHTIVHLLPEMRRIDSLSLALPVPAGVG